MISRLTKAVNVFGFIVKHPLTKNQKSRALLRYCVWQIISRSLRRDFLLRFVSDTKLLVRHGDHSAAGNFYVGLLSFEEMSFVLHYLRKGELFVDVGANIGAFTVLASGVCRSRTIAFEPSPKNFKKLAANIRVNDIQDLVQSYMTIVDNVNGVGHFVSDSGSVIDHVLEPGEESINVIEVPSITLDEVLDREQPKMIKIDVEGVETRILDGAERTLGKQSLDVLIVELKGHGKRYGFDERLVIKKLEEYGFVPIVYDPFTRSVRKIVDPWLNGRSVTEIFCRNPDLVEDRLAKGNVFQVLGHYI